MKYAYLLALSLLLALPSRAGQSKHRLIITFDYDFTHQPSCSSDGKKSKDKKKTLCVQSFVAYDISAGLQSRTKLISIPVVQDAHGMVKGITATTPLLLFESGRHLIAVVAHTSTGVESDPNQCAVWVNIPE
ncbi:MAG TPA: hypothetical protein VMF66_11325 [Candidatus Acidoferrum sp.]|nr:hypothetical protein [Candidatus Acidoferrum sp.]